ncbi:4-galactosyl-N-acetylglucosaminide 3-alpha-L-fucosyltransferase 9-like isoform X2 [Silurus meridionalis]|uniref:4-galactosyl-N-acetylglucosaminide 3-alpha-L-fucosyltransferase 9-like isoform X2 n=1 Tax=Silurus meridionalis TaxID=175797 RepID=UPI001EE9FF32|nr:4-galactosyl-N-acetylglucosaminide 3-alpha-L-fucosyltransferase 9-like isoform X2 [Silurus meridionalis]XP_046691239.1 4-galactosyl-N-acetylglucosaminide 3-alpha-L-fucosyltransferase 9-like isoform X2 [Silurus meridionalis]XP_046691246.1 4-galactosyl-N-acetylglucosaminide 3-alpha-L-fucosyltransferase 9-like isoform X2 [Silurus meridionalis]
MAVLGTPLGAIFGIWEDGYHTQTTPVLPVSHLLAWRNLLLPVVFQNYLPKCTPQTIPSYQSNFYKSADVSVPITTASTKTAQPKEEKPILLLWFLPENYHWDFNDCKTIYNIDGCQLTLDRNLYSQADAVLVFHKAISRDLSNLPPSPRPPFQKWIWFHVESPTNTPKIPGLENLFNVTLSYRRDADISVRYRLTVSKKPNENIVIPKKDKLLCWFVSNIDPKTGVGTRMNYYNELKKYINVHVFGHLAGSRMNDDDYYPTMASCKFYLAFENSIHKDYFVEKLNGPLAAGTVPVVMGPPRQNYEDFVPGNSFIHVEDFPNAKALAEYLLQLDKDEEAYKHYFDWRKHLTATPHLVHWNQEFTMYICQACEYVGRHKEYKAAHNIYKWWFS